MRQRAGGVTFALVLNLLLLLALFTLSPSFQPPKMDPRLPVTFETEAGPKAAQEEAKAEKAERREESKAEPQKVEEPVVRPPLEVEKPVEQPPSPFPFLTLNREQMASADIGKMPRRAPGDGKQIALDDGSDDFGGHDRRFRPHNRNLRHPVFAQDRDRVRDRLGRVRVHQRGKVFGLAVQHIADGRVGARWQESIGRQPVIVEDLAEVTATRVGEHHDDDVAGLSCTGDTQGGNGGHSAGATHQESFFPRQTPGHLERLGVGCLHFSNL